MKILRVPETRFHGMKDYSFMPHFLFRNGLRMHYVDEGPRKSNPIFMLHGNPSWSYLYRHMIRICVSAGNRVIAPDLIGFGKSDKMIRTNDYSYQNQLDWMAALLQSLDLRKIVLFCQDWGALIGLRLAAENKERFAGIIVCNGMLPTGDQKAPAIFKLWKMVASYSPWLPIDRIVDFGCRRKLDKEERRAYRAPFPSSQYKRSVRIYPSLVPLDPQDPAAQANRKAWKVLENWKKPFLTVFGNSDPFTRGWDVYLQSRIPGAKGQKHAVLCGGHFLQEDAGPELADIINHFADNVNESGCH